MHTPVNLVSTFPGISWPHLSGLVITARKRGLSFALALGLTACNAPPMYETQAHEYLEKQGVSSDLIVRLEERKPLTESEAVMLEQYENKVLLHLLPGNPITAVLHLLANNPSIPAPMIVRLAANRDEVVRLGVVYNPSAPSETLLALRTHGKYSTMNTMLAQNPRIPTEVLVEMYRNQESIKMSFAMNPNCPLDLMREIADQGTDFDRTVLAANPSLPVDLIARLARDPSENVQCFLAQNRAFKNWKAAGGASAKEAPQ